MWALVMDFPLDFDMYKNVSFESRLGYNVCYIHIMRRYQRLLELWSQIYKEDMVMDSG